MKKVLEYLSDKDHYTADACVVWCFDERFTRLLSEFKKKENLNTVDLIKIAGGAKDIASPTRESDREYVLDQIHKSIALHHTKQVVLMVHNECGAYGGNTEIDFYVRELELAREVLKKYFQEVNMNILISLYCADFQCLSKIE
jgi:carbonic anhydrase